MPAQDNTSRPSRDRAQRAICSGPLPYFLSSAIASSNAAKTTAANNLRARLPCSLLKAFPSTKSFISYPFFVTFFLKLFHPYDGTLVIRVPSFGMAAMC